MATPEQRSAADRVDLLLAVVTAFLADRFVTERLELRAENVEELSGPLGSLVASVITARAGIRMSESARRLEWLTVALIVLTVVLIGLEITRLLLGA